MKLLLVSCLHGMVDKKIKSVIKTEKLDAVLCCGDLCDNDKLRDIEFGNWKSIELIEAIIDHKKYIKLVEQSAKSMKISLKFFGSLNIPIFLVYGNNDFLASHLKKMKITAKGLEQHLPKNVTLLKNTVIQFENIFIAGFPGYRTISEKREKRNTHEKNLIALMNKIRKPESTIFLTHDVPYNRFDIVKLRESPLFGLHVGERLFNKHLKKKKLLAFVCGHMHEYQGVDDLYETPVINTGYGRIGKCAVLDIDRNKIKKIKFYK